MLKKIGWLGPLALTAVAVACGDDVDVQPVCTPGETQICSGPGACEGAQVCNSAGTGWDACLCGSGGSGGGPAPTALPPPRPQGAGPGDGPGIVLAVDQLFLGDTDWEGMTGPNSWELFGYDLDGHVSDYFTYPITDLCQVQPGGTPAHIHRDGPGGIDNSWGRNMLPTWMSLAPDFSAATNDAIAAGDATFLLKIDSLGSAPDYDPLVGKWYQARSLGAAPAWDGSDAWPVASEALQNPGDIESALATFSNSYLTNQTWVSDPGATVMLELNGLDDFPWALTIHHAVITMELAADRSEATRGIIAGVIDTEEHIDMFRRIAGYLDPGMCGGSSTFEQIATQIRRQSDIMADGTQDPDQLCNGISIGLGFRARPAQLGTVAPPNELPPDPCAGSGGSG